MKFAFSHMHFGYWILAAILSGLIACSSPSEKAERIYQKGMLFLQQGDLVKAGLGVPYCFADPEQHDSRLAGAG